ncbi:MAG TPA: transcriptional coactivator p15/PC4 family protein [Anaerolineae bacterium]|nr:transcriptional coactivator p15/PC4 family protein [Anaerolineae bacterium]
MSDQQVVFNENGKNPLVVALTTYKGAQRLDIRYHYRQGSDLLPTQRGISLPVGGLAEEALRAARRVNGEVVELDQQAREPLLVQHSVYRGQVRLDIRRHYWQNGDLHPGKRGVSLSMDDGLADAVLGAAEQLLGLTAALPARFSDHDAPDMETLEAWLMDGIAEATDGCTVEPDGVCPHGCRSWLLELGMV